MKPPLAAVVLALVVGSQGAAQQPPPQPPTFRTGTNVVRVDVTVVDRRGNPVTMLTADDFEVRDDGQPQAITTFKLVEASGLPTDELSLPIRSPEHAKAEAARDDVRVFLFFWDEYHVGEFTSAIRGREALERIVLTAFGPTDLVAIMDPLTPTDAVRFTRDRRSLADQAHKLKGRRGLYYPPRSVIEEGHIMLARGRGGDIEIIRQQVTTSAIRSAAEFLGSLKEGRKSLVLISETLGPVRSSSEYADVMRDLLRAANDTNTAIYVFDPRGLQVGGRTSDMLASIAYGSGGQPILTNDMAGRFKRVVVNPSSAFYLLGYAKEVAADGKFHEIKVRVKRPGLEVRARSGYWAPRLKDLTAATAAAAAAVLPPPVEAAFASLMPLRSPSPAEIWTGISTDAGGRALLSIAWRAHGTEDPLAAADTVSVVATAGNAMVFSGAVAAGGTSFTVPPGPLELAITVRDAKGDIVDRVPRTLVVPDPATSPLAVTTPAVVRARSVLEWRANAVATQLPVHAGRDFERTDRVLVRFAIQGGRGEPTIEASLLDRRGAKLVALPVEADAARGGHQIELPLSSIARGEYVIAIDVRRGEERAEAHVAFRVVR